MSENQADQTFDKVGKEDVSKEVTIKDGLEDECIQDVLERKEREEEEERNVSHDAFESGVIWTQVNATQIQREHWIRAGRHTEKEDEPFKPVYIEGRGNTSVDDPLDNDGLTTNVSVDDGYSIHYLRRENNDAAGEEGSQNQNAEPWWEKGKTAPLLDQYDDRRRMWYMAQAGVYDESDSVHDAQARQQPIVVQSEAPAILEIQDSPQRRTQQRDPSSSPPIIVEQTPTRRPPATAVNLASTSSSSRPRSSISITPQANENNTPATLTNPIHKRAAIPTSSSSSSFFTTPQRAALTLAGNLNTPISQRNTPIQTPKRKTWESTWALREQAKAAAAASAATGSASGSVRGKKRKSNGGGNGGSRAGSASSTPVRGTVRSLARGTRSPATSNRSG